MEDFNKEEEVEEIIKVFAIEEEEPDEDDTDFTLIEERKKSMILTIMTGMTTSQMILSLIME